MYDDDIQERMLTAWIGINGFFKDSRMTQDLTYNEAVVMKLVYDQYRADGDGRTPVQSIVKRTNMLKSLVNRTVDISEERRVGTECTIWCMLSWSQYN